MENVLNNVPSMPEIETFATKGETMNQTETTTTRKPNARAAKLAESRKLRQDAADLRKQAKADEKKAKKDKAVADRKAAKDQKHAAKLAKKAGQVKPAATTTPAAKPERRKFKPATGKSATAAPGGQAAKPAKKEVKDNFKSALKKLPSFVAEDYDKAKHTDSNALGQLVAKELRLYNDKETRDKSRIKTTKNLFSANRYLKVYTTIKL